MVRFSLTPTISALTSTALFVCLSMMPVASAQNAAPQTIKPAGKLPPASSTRPAAAPPKEVVDSLANTLEAISDAYQINMVTDAFPQDAKAITFMPVISANPKGDPMPLLQGIAERFHLEITQRGGLYVIRHKRWALHYKNQQTSPPQWGAQNPLRVTRLDKPYSDVAFAAADALDTQTPAQRVDINGRSITCARLGTALQEDANWTVHIDRSVSARRVNVFVKNVSPAAVLGAVAYLINAGEEVTLKPTDAQIAAEKYDSIPLGAAERTRHALSDALQTDMEKLLTKEQKADLDNGKHATFSLGDLPPNLQKRALNYINVTASFMSNVVAPPDTSKWKDFHIRFQPNNNGVMYRVLGVETKAVDGREYSF